MNIVGHQLIQYFFCYLAPFTANILSILFTGFNVECEGLSILEQSQRNGVIL